MNDPDNFLARWSRRKRAAADESAPSSDDHHERSAQDAEPAEQAGEGAPLPAQSEDSGVGQPQVDLSALPSLESITAETDIRAFLAPGVPAELRLAALRRAWVADPKVRDFVGLNDNDFDFHTPGAIPGFGPLQMTDELRREVVRIVGGWQPEPPAPATSAVEIPAPAPDVAAQPAAAVEKTSAPSGSSARAAEENSNPASAQQTTNADEPMPAAATAQRSKDDVASQQEQSHSENLQTLARRGHGRALPK